MSGAGVTIYNDDEFGRSVQFCKLNTRSGVAFEHTVVPPGIDANGNPAHVEISEDEIVIITRAEQ